MLDIRPILWYTYLVGGRSGGATAQRRAWRSLHLLSRKDLGSITGLFQGLFHVNRK